MNRRHRCPQARDTSPIISDYRGVSSPMFLPSGLIKQRHTLRSADRCADTMNPDVATTSRELRKRNILSVVESLSHLNVHYFVWPRAFF
ncbi:hypothetical protein AVEN_270653-1 [Araneus ventricosus]|uniref:Uncharacterized protein n=1 Tax=Araneus ventricosus TaxID=182803 RepID=A0A4Y2PUR8_ARAVE|nr:hypothetical protein AVEN_270653-1 [Araneus ventricosus]